MRLCKHDYHSSPAYLCVNHAVEVVEVCVLRSLSCYVPSLAQLDWRSIDVVAHSFGYIEPDPVLRKRLDVDISVSGRDSLSGEAGPL